MASVFGCGSHSGLDLVHDDSTYKIHHLHDSFGALVTQTSDKIGSYMLAAIGALGND